MVVADAGADRVRGAEVEGRAVDRGDLAGRDQSLVGRREMVGVEGQLVAEDRAGAFAGEVEIGVVGQVDDGRPRRWWRGSRCGACRRWSER